VNLGTHEVSILCPKLDILFLIVTEYIGLFPIPKQFLKKISSSPPGGKSSILKIPVYKLYECPNVPAAKFVHVVSLLEYYSQLK
jgi:hypothetical protein